MDDVVELHLAYMFDCPSCGCENFCRSVVPSLSEEEEEELREEHGIQPWEQGVWHSAPKYVLCGNCDARFLTSLGEEYE